MSHVTCNMKHVTWALGIVFLIDRVSKYAAQNLPDGKVFSVLPGLDFGYFLNPALFFFPAWRFVPWLALTVFITMAILFIIKLQEYRSTHTKTIGYWLLAIGSILLGGGSNVFDRFAYDGVIDIIHIAGLATINLADILILLGLILLMRKPYDKRS